MAKAIQPGGAYLSADGKTWHDANGKPIAIPFVREEVSILASVPIEPEADIAPEVEPEPVKKAPKAPKAPKE